MGKERMNYKMQLKLLKVTYSNGKPVPSGWRFKVKVIRYRQIRGKHTRIFTTQSNRKGQIKCEKQGKFIQMTLFYDRQAKKFQQKKMEIEAQLYDQLQQVKQQYGETTLNIINYMKVGQEIPLVVKLYGSKQGEIVIKFKIIITKQDQDNKSIKTNQASKSTQYIDNRTQNKIPNNKGEDIFQKSGNINYAKPPKYPKRAQKFISQKDEFSQRYIQNSQQTDDNFNHNSLRVTPRKFSSNLRKDSSSQKPKIKLQSNGKEQDEIIQLKLFNCQRELRQSQKALALAQATINTQNHIIAKLQEEQTNGHISSEAKKHLKEIATLKQQLLRANLKISELQSINRNLQNSERQNMRKIDLKSKQVVYYKSALEDYKIKIGNLMQRCFQAKQFDFMAVIEEQIGDD